MNIASSWMAGGTRIPGHLNAWPILMAASILFSWCHWQSGRLFYEHEDHPPVAGGDVIGRLRSDRLSIAKGQLSVREQCFDAKQLLQFAPSTPGRTKGRQHPALHQAGTFRCPEPDQENCRCFRDRIEAVDRKSV